MLRGHDGRCGLAVERRGAGRDARHAGHLGGDHGHVGGGEQRVFAARHVAADGVDRDVLVAEHDARQRLHLDVHQRGLLVLGEGAHLGLREADVVQVARRQLGHGVADFLIGEAEILPVPAVELGGHLAHRGVPARGDVGQDRLDGGADLGVLGGDVVGVAAVLQEVCHAT